MEIMDVAGAEDDIEVVCSDGICTVIRVASPDGEGYMISYEVFPGVALLYNDFHMERMFSGSSRKADLFCIDHCREGRIEWERPGGHYVYIEAGDLHMSRRRKHDADFSFPLKHYHGITVALSLEEANNSLYNLLEGVDIDIHALAARLTSGEAPLILRANDSIQHVFSELYRVPEAIRIPYCKVKVLELLVFLSGMDVNREEEQRPYYHRSQVDKVKAIARFMTEQPDRHYTLEELSGQFDIPLTSLKTCFKGVFGDTLFHYMRTWRMNAAAVALRQTDKSVIAIANSMGYENASKFASAFKTVMGKTPTEYRKSSD